MFKEEVRTIQDMRKTVSAALSYVKESVSIMEETEYKIKLALNELLANSLEHSVSKCANLMCRVEETSVNICVFDGGQGFDYSYMRKMPNISSEHGRGVFLVYELCDEVEFNKKGNAVLVRISL